MPSLREQIRLDLQAAHAKARCEYIPALWEDVGAGRTHATFAAYVKAPFEVIEVRAYDTYEEALADMPSDIFVSVADVDAFVASMLAWAQRIRGWCDTAPWDEANKQRWLVYAEMMEDRYTHLDDTFTPMPSPPSMVTGREEVRRRIANGEFQYATDSVPTPKSSIHLPWIERQLERMRAGLPVEL